MRPGQTVSLEYLSVNHVYSLRVWALAYRQSAGGQFADYDLRSYGHLRLRSVCANAPNSASRLSSRRDGAARVLIVSKDLEWQLWIIVRHKGYLACMTGRANAGHGRRAVDRANHHDRQHLRFSRRSSFSFEPLALSTLRRASSWCWELTSSTGSR